MVSGRASRPRVQRDTQPPARPQPRLTDASHSIAITGMFNAHHTSTPEFQEWLLSRRCRSS